MNPLLASVVALTLGAASLFAADAPTKAPAGASSRSAVVLSNTPARHDSTIAQASAIGPIIGR